MYSLILKQYTEFVQSYNLTDEMNSKVQELSTEMNSLNERIKVGRVVPLTIETSSGVVFCVI